MQQLQRNLLVDDSPRDTELALEVLESSNLANEVLTLREGAEVVDCLHRCGQFAGSGNALPAVILLDLKMPEVNGLEVLRQIKGDPELKVIPVVVITSSREEQDRIRSYQLGVNAFMVKPVSFREFVDAVKLLGSFWGVVNQTASLHQ